MIKLPVTWSVCGFVEIDVPSIADAVEFFYENKDEIDLPHDHDYIESSFELSSDDEGIIAAYQKEEH